MEKIFMRATRDKTRFEYRGLLSVEDLWDLDVESLDSIFKKLSAEKRQVSEESLLEVKTVENTLLNNKIEIVKYIVEYKLKLAKDRENYAEKKAKKEKILEIIANKQEDALGDKSEEELQDMLNSL